MYSLAIYNQLAFDTVITRSNDKANEACSGTCARVRCGGRRRGTGNIELYVSQSEGVYTELEPPLNYPPGHIRNNIIIQARSEMACCLGVTPWEVEPRQCKIYIRRG